MSNVKVGSLDEIMQRNNEISDYTINGECSNCGACCNDIIPLTNADVNRIKRYLRKNNIKPITNRMNFLAKKTLDTTCPFRDNKNNKCIIYEVRPLVCRCFKCNNYYTEFWKHYKKFKDVKSISMKKTFFEKES